MTEKIELDECGVFAEWVGGAGSKNEVIRARATFLALVWMHCVPKLIRDAWEDEAGLCKRPNVFNENMKLSPYGYFLSSSMKNLENQLTSCTMPPGLLERVVDLCPKPRDN